MTRTAERASEIRQVVAAVIGLSAVYVTATLQWQIPGAVSAGALLTVVVLGGALAGRVVVPGGERMRAHLAAMVGGALATAGGFAVVAWWISERSSVGHLELLFFGLLGSTPGVLIGSIGFDKLRRGDEVLPTAVVR